MLLILITLSVLSFTPWINLLKKIHFPIPNNLIGLVFILGHEGPDEDEEGIRTEEKKFIYKHLGGD